MLCSSFLGILAVPGKQAFCNAETFWVKIQVLLWPIATTLGQYKNIVTGHPPWEFIYLFIYLFLGGAVHVEGFQARQMEFENFERKFEVFSCWHRFCLDPSSVSSDTSTVDLHYCYNDSFSCFFSSRSAFQSQQYKPSLNLMLWVDLKLPTWWRILWGRL